MKKDDMSCECDIIDANIVSAAKKHMPIENELKSLSDFFKILGDGTRVKIISALYEGEMCVCSLATLLGMTKSAISHQLSLLRQNNLVKNRKEGRIVYYSLADEHIKEIFKTGLEHIRESTVSI